MTLIPGIPEPVSIYPPATSRTLDEWLQEESASPPPSGRSRLSQIAWNRAADIAAASASVAGGITLILFGAYWSVFASIPAPILVFTILGAVFVAVGLLVIRRARTRLPSDRILRVVRGPSSAGSGVVTAATIWGVLAAITIPSWLASPTAIEGADVMFVGFLLFFALLLVTCFVVPAVVLGRANESLRRIAATAPAYREQLEQDRLTWRPTAGAQMYGPL